MMSSARFFRCRIAVLTLVAGLIFILPCQGPAFCSGNDSIRSAEENPVIPEDRLKSILSAAEKNFGRITTLKTELTQEKNLSLFSEPVVSTGILLFKAPGNIRLEFFDPFKSVLLVSDGRVAKFESFNGQWKRMNPGSKKIMGVILDHIASWVKGQFNRENLYEVSGRYRSVGNHQAFSIVLVPRAEEFRKFIQAFELGINPGMDRLDYIIIRESGKDYTKLRFHHDLINTPVNEIYFNGDPLAPVPQW